MTSLIFNQGKHGILNGDIDLINDQIKVALMTNAYSPDEDGDEYYSDLNGEAIGTGYISGGKSLLNKSIGKDDSNHRAEFDADNLVWNVITVSDITGCVLYKATGNNADSPLIAYIDFGYSFLKIGDDLTIVWNADGILSLEGI